MKRLAYWSVLILSDSVYALTDSTTAASSIDPGSLSCDFGTLSNMRSTWGMVAESCSQKLPFEFWIYMKAEGTAGDPDAKHVWNACLKPRTIDFVELITPESWNTTIMEVVPGQLLRETKRAASYLVQSPLDFEAMCADDEVAKVTQVDPTALGTHALHRRNIKRHLQSTFSEAGNAHGVDALIAGLEGLGCERTTGEDQTLCLMSDSFNLLGGQAGLQESGDLPPDEFLTIVEELSDIYVDATGITPFDEGSAMAELAYDIARGANFKFNTMFMGNTAAADDIIKLGTSEDDGGEACDVIVDDITQGREPGFRDGVVAQAVDEVVADGALYFSSAGNYRNGYKFTANWECTTDLFGEDVSDEPCEDNGSASHVFNPEATGRGRYLFGGFDSALLNGQDVFILHWDDDEGTSRSVQLDIWSIEEDEYDSFTPFNRVVDFSDFESAVLFMRLPSDFVAGRVYYFSITQSYSDLDDVEMRILSWNTNVFRDFSDGSIFGQQCASSTISVAAYDISDASGVDGAFADPETSFVPSYSSRGPCYIDSGSGLETRLKPVTTAATNLEVSTNPDVFTLFRGTSASAPVAAAIATIIRAACYPRVVTLDDMMDMLTNYDYTVDVTSDAGEEPETWGTEAGYGIISAKKMLGWVAENCQESCPGETTMVTPVPSPVVSSSGPPVVLPTEPSLSPSPTPSIAPSMMPPISPPTPSPIAAPTEEPLSEPTAPTTSQEAPPSAPPASSVSSSVAELVDVSERTSVTVSANAYDERTSGFGCSPDGCVAANTRDNDLSTRWSCMEELTDGGSCKLTLEMEEPQDIVLMQIAFYKGDTRTRQVKVNLNDSEGDVIESSGETTGPEIFEINTEDTKTLSLEAVGLSAHEWIALTEVRLMVL